MQYHLLATKMIKIVFSLKKDQWLLPLINFLLIFLWILYRLSNYYWRRDILVRI